MENQIDWSKASIEDYALVSEIVKRASKIPGFEIKAKNLEMDIIATHISGCRLKLQELLDSMTGDFLHDICGIVNHIDRNTGQLQECFLPRYSV